MIETHDLELVPDLLGQVEAVCSCGWSETFDDSEDAKEGFDNHCDVVFMEATMEQGRPTEVVE